VPLQCKTRYRRLVTTSSATRLSRILRALREQTPETRAADAWAKALDLPSVDPAPLLRALADVQELAAQVEIDIERLGQHRVVLDRYDEVIAVCDRGLHLEKSIGWALEPLHDTGMQALTFAASLLEASLPEVDVPPDELRRLTQLVQQLMDEVAINTALQEEDRNLLLGRLAELHSIIRRISIVGAAVVWRSVGEVVLVVVSKPRTRWGTVLTSLGALVATFDLVLNVLANAEVLIEPPAPPATIQVIVNGVDQPTQQPQLERGPTEGGLSPGARSGAAPVPHTNVPGRENG